MSDVSKRVCHKDNIHPVINKGLEYNLHALVEKAICKGGLDIIGITPGNNWYVAYDNPGFQR